MSSQTSNTAAPANRRPARAQAGQAIVELLVCVGVLIALFAGVVLVGRYHEIQAATIAASRYAAFERGALSSSGHLLRIEALARGRFFERPPGALTASDARAADERWSPPQAWRDLAGRRALLEQPAHVRIEISDASIPGAAGTTARTALGVLRTSGLGSPYAFDLAATGFVTASVEALALDLTAGEEQGVPPRLRLRERVALLGEDWSSPGPRRTAERTAAISPAGWFASIRSTFAPARWALSILEPAFAQFCPGRIDPEIVPADRLRADPRAPRGMWRASC
jgi:hypothetical protein